MGLKQELPSPLDVVARHLEFANFEEVDDAFENTGLEQIPLQIEDEKVKKELSEVSNGFIDKDNVLEVLYILNRNKVEIQ